jgi:adenosylmethionine-8-amino-7-oxononanoate aminotransferase
MKDYEKFTPFAVRGALGSYIELANGKKMIDVISSWWCKTLGHNHPRLQKAAKEQIDKFEHIILANTTNEAIVQLSEKLVELIPNLDKVFYAGDGSCAVEIALKMSIQSRVVQGDTKRSKFISLQNGYHGETIGALSVSDLGLYKNPFKSMIFESYFIDNIPYVNSVDDPLWNDCSEIWQVIVKTLNEKEENITAIIFEPIVQGAGGMKIYSKDFLKRLASWAKERDIHLIADEIMTGLGRTGKIFACDHADIKPDFLCLSKGLTSGWMPFSAVLTTNDIYQLFYDDYKSGKSFLHSHTYCGNALAASIATETLNILEENDFYQHKDNSILFSNMQEVAEITGKLENIRSIGAIVAADIKQGYFGKRGGDEVFQRAVKCGLLLRPLGNTIYWLPPLNTESHTIEEIKSKTIQSLVEVTDL